MNNLVFCIVTIQYIFYMMQNTLTDSTIHSTEPLTNSIQKQNPWAILFRTLDPFYSETEPLTHSIQKWADPDYQQCYAHTGLVRALYIQTTSTSFRLAWRLYTDDQVTK